MTRRAIHFRSDADWARFEHGLRPARGLAVAMVLAFVVCFVIGAIAARGDTESDGSMCWAGAFPPRLCDGREQYCTVECVEWEDHCPDYAPNCLIAIPPTCLKRVRFCGEVMPTEEKP